MTLATTAILALFAILTMSLPSAATAATYAVAMQPTPVFATADIAGLFGGADGSTLRLDACGQMRELEFIALPGTVFTVEESLAGASYPRYRVTTRDYPYPAPQGYYIDGRFVTLQSTRLVERPKRLPEKGTIIADLLAAQGSRYVWGGNVRQGVASLTGFHPPADPSRLTTELAERWQLRGCDCSGLLYEATGGWTPRNTSSLVTYGTGVPIAGLTAGAIASRLEPLDLIVWPGHVMIVIDRDRVIESRLECGAEAGVIVSPLKAALARVMKRRVAVNGISDQVPGGRTKFVIRRWYGSGNQ
jgi:hypothetical protein